MIKKNSIIYLILLFLCITIYPVYSEQQPCRQLSLQEYTDKVAGGWLGQAIGVLYAQWTEGRWQGEIVPFDLEDWYRIKPEIEQKINEHPGDWQEKRKFAKQFVIDKQNWEIYKPEEMSDQDDLYVEFMFLHAIHKYGLDVTAREIAEEWISYIDPERIWCANKGAYDNFLRGIWPPLSGNPRYTPWGDAIDFQIEADLFGLISPGMPRISNAWGDKVGHIMNYGDGVYAGMAVAAMYCEAFFEKNPRVLAEYSLKAIPAESGYAKMVQDVLDLHQRYPNWQDAWKKLEPKWGIKDGKLVSGVDVRINGAYIYMGLLYGEGDFWKSMNISMRCGRDSDCNPSSVVGILGTVMGLQNIPVKWSILKDLPIDNIAIKEIFPQKIQWNDLIDKTVEVGKWNILQNGGYIKGDIINIPYKTPTSLPLEQTVWEETKK
ncbi:MAG TPA: ADP-ribosylglycohydrolase family protein [bacterium]|nr:ADP-ribosylglycohydrolase family protein [bacterium]HPN43074.1 ADP-ribosylglycohydrolase family protein [bacterium]